MICRCNFRQFSR